MVYVQSTASVQRLVASDLKLDSVTVYRDHAELKRIFSVTLKEGLNEIIVENVSNKINADSIRVDGSAQATTIHEVQLKSETKNAEETNEAQIKALTEEIETLKVKGTGIENLQGILKQQSVSLSTTLSNVNKATLKSDKGTELFQFDQSAEESLRRLFSFHETQSAGLNERINDCNRKTQEILAQIEAIKQKIGKLRGTTSTIKSISIVLWSEVDESPVNLQLFYNVTSASWRPSYHVRIDTGDQPKLKIVYFGELFGQSRDVITDTAQRPPMFASTSSNQEEFVFEQERSRGGLVISDDDDESPATPPLKIEGAITEKGLLSATFTIAQKKTIPSSSTVDSHDHKVTIATIDFDSLSLHFDCVPSKNPKDVFLTATAENNSNYPMLEGSASLFVDNCFTSKIHLKQIVAGEKFDIPIGVDPSVKLDYKAEQRQKQGVFASIIKTHDRKIVVRNTKTDETVALTIYQQIPKSWDQKIKISLESPQLTKPSDESGVENSTKRIAINKDNILEWKESLKPQEEKELFIKWTVEYPANEAIDYKEEQK
ncbi:protein F37C4.5 [Ditylenchus destructor]|uniref:Protein F37C4.5 n=1 Tax=Ditylenchus destructor TaxID=166010 RepID=A0AAD4R321_9BILA|nr:protein F37C4.5 [Ditylenchus destructor]